MGIDFYDRIWEEEQREKERFGQRKNEIENELSSQRRKIEQLEKENAELKTQIPQWHDLRKNPNDLPTVTNSQFLWMCWINPYGNMCYHPRLLR